MKDILHKYDWLIAYFVYNNSFYELDQFNSGKGILENKYFTMKNQTNYLFNLIEQLTDSRNIKIVIVSLDYDYLNSKTDFKIIEKNGTNLNLKNKLFSSQNALTNEENITHVLNTINRLYNFKRIAITTFGHGSLFGINLTSQKLHDDIKKNENKIDFNNIKEFNDFVLCNKTLFEPSKIYENIYQVASFKMIQYIKLNLKKSIQDKSFNSLYNKLSKKIKNVYDFKFSNHNKKSIVSKSMQKLQEYTLQFFNSDNDLMDKILQKNILTNKEFSEGIKNSNLKKVDVIVMYNCLMQNIYTQFEFKDTTEYLVAPVGGIGFPGYDYKGVHLELLKNINLSTKDFADLYITTLQTGELQNMIPFKQNFDERLFVTSEKINTTNLENLQKGYLNWINEYENCSKQADYYFEPKMKVVAKKVLLGSVSNAVTKCFNLSSKNVTVLSLVDFYVFLDSFLYELEVNNIILKNKSSLIDFTKNLISIFSNFSNTCNPNNGFYENSNKINFEDNKFRISEFNKLGKGIILNKYPIQDTPFLDSFFGINPNIPNTIIPSFLQNEKTGELLMKV